MNFRPLIDYEVFADDIDGVSIFAVSGFSLPDSPQSSISTSPSGFGDEKVSKARTALAGDVRGAGFALTH